MVAMYSTFVQSFLLLLVTLILVVFPADGLLGRGFGDHIDWKTYTDGLKEAQSSHKPVMLIIHKSWCGACKALKPKFAESKEIGELSKNFVMINVEDDEEPQDTQYEIDGAYIPRIFILVGGGHGLAWSTRHAWQKRGENITHNNSSGRVQKDIYNKKGNPSYKYYYGNAPAVVDGMKAALELMIEGVRIGDEL